MSITKPIFLIGLPGVGKTHVGLQLAKACDIPFMDSDVEILKNYNLQHQTDLSISEIFRAQGAFYFRKLERDFIKKLITAPQIVACGGGLPCYFDNIEQLKQLGIIVWLISDFETNVKNIIASNVQRPLFMDKNEVEISQILQNLLQERQYFYQQAHFSVPSQNGSALVKVLEIAKNLAP